MDILHARADGTFVIRLHGHPYHVVESDPLFPVVAAAAEGRSFPEEEIPAEAAPFSRAVTPLQWMDRIPPDRQTVLLDALDATPEGRRFQKRMLAAREIDPTHEDVRAGVAMLRAAKVITDDEAALLLQR